MPSSAEIWKTMAILSNEKCILFIIKWMGDDNHILPIDDAHQFKVTGKFFWKSQNFALKSIFNPSF